MIWPMVTGVGAVAYRLRLTPSTRLPSWFLLPSEWVNGPDVVEPNCGPDLLKHLARLEGFEPPAFWSVARRSIQLSYRRRSKSVEAAVGAPTRNSGGEGGI